MTAPNGMPTLQVGSQNSWKMKIASVVISGDLELKCLVCGNTQPAVIDNFADVRCEKCGEGEIK